MEHPIFKQSSELNLRHVLNLVHRNVFYHRDVLFVYKSLIERIFLDLSFQFYRVAVEKGVLKGFDLYTYFQHVLVSFSVSPWNSLYVPGNARKRPKRRNFAIGTHICEKRTFGVIKTFIGCTAK